jgi:hypothetical protein
VTAYGQYERCEVYARSEDKESRGACDSARGRGRQGFTAKGGEGKLVRDILDTKDELDKGQKEEAEQEGSKETGIILGRGRKKGGDGVKKEEIQRLREVRARRAHLCGCASDGGKRGARRV